MMDFSKDFTVDGVTYGLSVARYDRGEGMETQAELVVADENEKYGERSLGWGYSDADPGFSDALIALRSEIKDSEPEVFGHVEGFLTEEIKRLRQEERERFERQMREAGLTIR